MSLSDEEFDVLGGRAGIADQVVREDARELGELKEELKDLFQVQQGRTLFGRVSEGEQPQQAQVQG
jgi:hypothetical protein